MRTKEGAHVFVAVVCVLAPAQAAPAGSDDRAAIVNRETPGFGGPWIGHKVDGGHRGTTHGDVDVRTVPLATENLMHTAIILINVATDQTNRVAEELAAMPGISEVYSVAGKIDLVAILRVTKNEDLADLVTGKIRNVAGIVNTETLIAFRAYSRRDIAALFDLD
jgi:DNA-binding Lrp family transcriptional regulator